MVEISHSTMVVMLEIDWFLDGILFVAEQVYFRDSYDDSQSKNWSFLPAAYI